MAAVMTVIVSRPPDGGDKSLPLEFGAIFRGWNGSHQEKARESSMIKRITSICLD
jgi:hypothetical protein